PIELRRYPEIRRALDTRQTVLVTDVATDPLYAEAREAWETGGVRVPTRSAIAIPFVMKDQRAGVFFLRTTAEDTPLNQSDLTFAEQVIRAAVQALEKAYDLESAVVGREQMKTLAETDALTETYNRRALADKLVQEIERANRYSTQLACLMIDVDNFKQINDNYGHLAGDVVLRQLGGIFRREQRTVDIVARFGGEEFVILLPETGVAGARIFADRVLKKVASYPFGEGGSAIRVTVSVGVACYPDERVQDGEALLKLADQNLYK